MSIVNTFDNKSEAVINPSHIAPRIEGFPKVAVVAFGERMITALREHYNPVQIDEMVACVSIPVYKINFEGKDLAVYCSTVGGPAAAGLMEEMISKGCEKFVFFGSCGVLDRVLAAKSLIIPTAAYRDEGTSYHYVPPSDYIEVPTAHYTIRRIPQAILFQSTLAFQNQSWIKILSVIALISVIAFISSFAGVVFVLWLHTVPTTSAPI